MRETPIIDDRGPTMTMLAYLSEGEPYLKEGDASAPRLLENSRLIESVPVVADTGG